MFPIPAAAEPLVEAIAGAFTRPTFARFVTLACGLIVTMGRRTVSHALVPIVPVMRGGHWSNYHRLYSSARFSMWKLAAALVRQVIALLPAGAVIELVADDTVDGKDGVRVWGRGSHYDACRSSRSRRDHVKFGHQWLVLCVLVRLPGLARPWALPVLCVRAVPLAEGGGAGGPAATQDAGAAHASVDHGTDALAAGPQVRAGRGLQGHHARDGVLRQPAWASGAADGGEPAARRRANLYDRPRLPHCRRGHRRRRRSRNGRLPAKGRKLPSPAARARRLRPRREKVAWYGSSRRVVRHVSEAALWYNKHHTRKRAARRAVQRPASRRSGGCASWAMRADDGPTRSSTAVTRRWRPSGSSNCTRRGGTSR
jgi:hypothetical protein